MKILAYISGYSDPPVEGMHAQTGFWLGSLVSSGYAEVRIISELRPNQFVQVSDENKIGGGIRFTSIPVQTNYAQRFFSRFIFGFQRRKIANYIISEFERAGSEVIYLEGVPLMPILPLLQRYKVIYSCVDAWSLRQSRLARTEKLFSSCLRRLYAWFLYYAEAKFLASAKRVHVYSEADANYLRAVSPKACIVAIPTSRVTPDNYTGSERRSVSAGLQIVCWGDMSIPYIRKGLEEFLVGAWPHLLKDSQQHSMTVLGRTGLKNLDGCHSIAYVDWVKDLDSALRASDLLLFVDTDGTGIKNRVIHALSLGCIVVSSKPAAEGIKILHGKSGFLYSSQAELISILRGIHAGLFDLSSVRSSARELYLNEYSSEVVVERWRRLVESAALS